MTLEAEILADGPDVYLRLNETSGTVAADSSGNGNDWTYSVDAAGMTTTTLVVGDGDAAVTISDPTNTVGSPITPSYLPAGGLAAYTLEMLVKISSYGGAFGDQLGGSNPANPYFMLDGAGIVTFVTDGPNCIGPTLALGTTYHLCATYDGANVVLYVDGTAVDTQAETGLDGVAAGQFFEIGYSSGNAAQFVAAYVAFYTAALSAGRVAVHAAAAGFAPTPYAGGSLLYTDYANGLWDPTAATLGAVDVLTEAADLRLIAIDPLTYVVDQDADVSLADIPSGAILATATPTGIAVVTRGLTFDPVTFASVPVGPDIGAVVLYKDTGTPSTSPLIGYFNDAATGLPVVTDGNDVQFNPGAGGIAIL